MNILMIDSQRVSYIDAGEYTNSLSELAFTIEVASAPTDEQLARADGVVAFHSVVIDTAMIAKMHRCRVLVKATIGLDDVDVDALSARRILCSNIGAIGAEEVAEHAMAFILLAQRKLLDYARHTRLGGWDWRAHAGQLKSCADSVLGLVGYGTTARAVARRAAAFGFRINFYDPGVDSCVEGIAHSCTLEELLGSADILSLHLPLTADSRHLLSDSFFTQVKRGASLVNTARGGIVDTLSLLRAVESGRLSQAFLDVVEEEPCIPEVLARHERIMLSPHAAFYSNRSLDQLKSSALDTVIALLQGKTVATLVNPEVLAVEVNGYA